METNEITTEAGGIIAKNAIQCGICGENADRYNNRFQCQKNHCHIGSLNFGIFTDLTHPFER